MIFIRANPCESVAKTHKSKSLQIVSINLTFAFLWIGGNKGADSSTYTVGIVSLNPEIDMNHQKILSLILSVAIVLAVFCTSASAQNSEDARVARLAGLAKVWGTVKYFHPYLASREIDWD